MMGVKEEVLGVPSSSLLIYGLHLNSTQSTVNSWSKIGLALDRG